MNDETTRAIGVLVLSVVALGSGIATLVQHAKVRNLESTVTTKDRIIQMHRRNMNNMAKTMTAAQLYQALAMMNDDIKFDTLVSQIDES